MHDIVRQYILTNYANLCVTFSSIYEEMTLFKVSVLKKKFPNNSASKPGSGFRTHTAQNDEAVEELVLSEEKMHLALTHMTSLDMHSRTRRTL